MAISLTNWDSSFFTVELSGISKRNPLYQELSKRVISFSVTEENGALIHGDITFQEDENCMMSALLAVGKTLDISWGYKDNNITSIDQAQKLIDNPQEIYSPTSPVRYVKGYIRNPSGSGSQDGKQEYKLSFVGMMGSKDNKMRNFTKDKIPGITRNIVVSTIMIEEKLIPFISFSSMADLANEYQAGVSNFKFLCQLAIKYNCLFRIGYNALGVAIALFCDYDNGTMIESFLNLIMGTVGISQIYNYKKGSANVKSYDWTIGEGGGDAARIQYVNGQPVIYRTVATPESTIVYQLNAAKITADMQAKGTSPAALVSVVNEMLKLNTMEELVSRKYFTEVTRTTAPQGVGINVNVEIIGNPYCTTPARAIFKDGFPAIFKIKTLIYYVNKVTHKIDKSGYSCSVNILDAFQFGLSMMGVK